MEGYLRRLYQWVWVYVGWRRSGYGGLWQPHACLSRGIRSRGASNMGRQRTGTDTSHHESKLFLVHAGARYVMRRIRCRVISVTSSWAYSKRVVLWWVRNETRWKTGQYGPRTTNMERGEITWATR